MGIGPSMEFMKSACPTQRVMINPERFHILEAYRSNGVFAIRLQYADCPGASHGGKKVCVYIEALDAWKWWEVIDPHFGERVKKGRTIAPSPIARFPGSDEGWEEALRYVDFTAEVRRA